MDHDREEQSVSPTSIFQKPPFWIGSLLWLGVIAAGFWVLNQKPHESRLQSSPGELQATPEAAESEQDQTKSFILKHDKNSSISLVESSEAAVASPWDADGIADFSFTDSNGDSVTKSDLLGKPWVVCFVFTHCALTCPAVTSSMRELQDQLKDRDFRLVTLTVDPERDSPEVLKGYGERFGADFRKWLFLGGDQREIYRLIQASFKMPVKEVFGEKRQAGFEFIHSNNIMLVDKQGIVRGKFNATKGPEMATLRRELQKLAQPVAVQSEAAGPASTTNIDSSAN